MSTRESNGDVRPPNILYIFADDMGYGDLGCNNPSSKIPTPNLDRLAEGGMRFTDMHASSAVCTPSRYSLLTGRYCWRTPLKEGVLWPWDAPLLEPDRMTVADLLRDQGYRTACIGKWHLGWQWGTLDGSPSDGGLNPGVYDDTKRFALGENIDFTKPLRGGPTDHGFDHYFGVDVPNFPPYTWFEGNRLTEVPTEDKGDELFGHPGKKTPDWSHEAMLPKFVQRACTFIQSCEDDPFFLYLPLTAPHTPICPNELFQGRSGIGPYGDFVCEVDDLVGQLMNALDERGILNNTLIIFSSDNGPEHETPGHSGAYQHAKTYGHYSMGDFRGIKRDAWEGGHRVPFIAHWPDRITPGAICDELIGLHDCIATCADLLKVDLPEGAGEDSVTMLPHLLGQSGPVRADIIYHSCHGKFGVRRGDWVLIDASTGDDNSEPDWFKQERGYEEHPFPGELYNLRDDPSERVNRYGEEPEIVEKLSALLESVKQGAGPSTTPNKLR